MTDDDLVKDQLVFLSEGRTRLGDKAVANLARQCLSYMDRIEALERERDELQKDFDGLDAASRTLINEARSIAEAAEARLAKAVEALRAFKDFDDMPTSHKRPDVFEFRVRRKLLPMLAEIEGGEKDE